MIRRNRKHLFVLPVRCNFSDEENVSVLPLALLANPGNIACDANAFACTNLASASAAVALASADNARDSEANPINPSSGSEMMLIPLRV